MRTKKQFREGNNAVTREELRKISNPDHNSGCLKPGEVYVCQHCDKIGYSKTEMGSCIGHQVKMTESALQEETRRRLHSFKPFRCVECGDTVELVTGPGRVEEYTRGRFLPVPDDFPIPTCPTCGESYFTVERGRALFDAQKAALRLSGS